MRNSALWLAIASIVGPLILTGTLFVPIAAALGGFGFQHKHEEPGIAPGLWIMLALAVVLALFIYPSHFESIAKCEELAAGVQRQQAFGLSSDDTRFAMLEAGCNNLPFFTMPV